MSQMIKYRRSFARRASFHATNAFSGVAAGKALAVRHDGFVVGRAGMFADPPDMAAVVLRPSLCGGTFAR
jgi:hypothetical protein